MASMLSIHVPVRTVSEANSREHWATRNRRKREQQEAVFYAWKAVTTEKGYTPKVPCVVHLTRFGPRLLDSDNLASAFKGIRDQVAKMLEVDDGDTRIRFEYYQIHDRGYGITIQVYPR